MSNMRRGTAHATRSTQQRQSSHGPSGGGERAWGNFMRLVFRRGGTTTLRTFGRTPTSYLTWNGVVPDLRRLSVIVATETCRDAPFKECRAYNPAVDITFSLPLGCCANDGGDWLSMRKSLSALSLLVACGAALAQSPVRPAGRSCRTPLSWCVNALRPGND